MLRLVLRTLLGAERFDRLSEQRLLARTHPRIAIALARASATSGLRHIDPARPSTWEFTGFSQNGEDGIVDYLCGRLLRPNRYFVEIGAANGLENNTSWLAMARRYGGLMIDGDAAKVAEAERTFSRLNWALQFHAMMVNRDNVREIERRAIVRNPDVFSVDIDGVDYHVTKALLDLGFRPKIFIVEYNAVFGPERSVTVPYKETFFRFHEHPTGHYYGVSVMGLRQLFEPHGYRFITVDQNGVNAFFADPAEFDRGFLDAIRGEPFRDNIVHRRETGTDWAAQFERIQHLPLVSCGDQKVLQGP